MELFGKDLDKELVVIAEIGVNHEGSVERCIDLIDMAQEAGATAAKLQYGTVESGGLQRKGGDFAFDEAQMREVAAYAKRVDMPLFSSALSIEALPLCDELFDVIKIASRGAKDKELIQAAAKTGKPVIISTGMCVRDDMYNILKWFRGSSGEPFVVMHCVSAYPVPIAQASIGSVSDLGGFGQVGYSNHVIGPAACYAAVALGANPIEVHFTDDKDREFRDHQLSFDKADLISFVKMAGNIKDSLGDGVKRVMECEK